MSLQTLERCHKPACRKYISYLENRLRSYESIDDDRLDSGCLPCPPTPPLPIVEWTPESDSGYPPCPPTPPLTIVEWTPESLSGPQQALEPQGCRKPRDYNAATISNFIARIPTSEADWKRKREAIGLNNEQGILQAFNEILLPQSTATAGPSSPSPRPSKLSHYLECRAIEAGEAGSKAQRAVAYATYGGLVFLGECCIALELGVSTEEVDNSTKAFLSKLRSSECKADSRTLRKYRRVPLWATEQMYRLYEVYYHRAFEVFLYGMSTMSIGWHYF